MLTDARYRVVTVPLQAERWQVDLIQKRMNLCVSIYNRMADELEDRYLSMLRSEDYRAAEAAIAYAYSFTGAEREAAKQAPAYVQAVGVQNQLLRAYGFTGHSCRCRAIEIADEYRPILPTRVASYTIGSPLWTAWHGVLIGRQTSVKRKRKGEIRALTSDGRSGIRLLDANLVNRRAGIDLSGEEPLITSDPCAYIVFGRESKKRSLRMPLRISRRDAYTIEVLQRPIRRLSIVRRDDPQGHPALFASLLVG